MSETVTPVVFVGAVRMGFHPKHVRCEQCKFCLTSQWNKDAKWCNLGDFTIANQKEMDFRCPLEKGDFE